MNMPLLAMVLSKDIGGSASLLEWFPGILGGVRGDPGAKARQEMAAESPCGSGTARGHPPPSLRSEQVLVPFEFKPNRGNNLKIIWKQSHLSNWLVKTPAVTPGRIQGSSLP